MATVSQQEGWKDEGGREGWSESEVWERVTVVGSEREEDKEGRAGGRRQRKKEGAVDRHGSRQRFTVTKAFKKKGSIQQRPQASCWLVYFLEFSKQNNKQKKKTKPKAVSIVQTWTNILEFCQILGGLELSWPDRVLPQENSSRPTFNYQ